MIARRPPPSVTGLPLRVPSYDDFCDDIEAMIRDALPKWRRQLVPSDGASEMGEKDLTSRLCIYLGQTAREKSVSWNFHHEHPQKGSRSEDMSLVPATTSGIWIGQAFFASHQRFYAIEAKRLPTPPDPKKKRDREREYVCGDWQRAKDIDKPISGGIERFKENKHGEGLTRSSMVAFVQNKNFNDLIKQVNGWIADLVKKIPSHNATWTKSDKLVVGRPRRARSLCCERTSKHSRSTKGIITLRHFWVDCRSAPKSSLTAASPRTPTSVRSKR